MSRQNWSIRKFNPSNKPGTCLFCGKKLQPWLPGMPSRGLGLNGDGFFCTIVDATSWATLVAHTGYRIVRNDS